MLFHCCEILSFPRPGSDLQITLFLACKKKLGMGQKIMDSPENLLNLCKDLEGKLTICSMLGTAETQNSCSPL